MSNKNTKSTVKTSTDTAEKETVMPETTKPESAATRVTTLVASGSSTITVTGPGSKFLKVLPAYYHEDLANLRDPSPEEVAHAVTKLPENLKLGYAEWMKRMNPQKRGFRSAGNNFEIPTLKINQGTGNDPNKPGNAPKGAIYSSDGLIMAAPSDVADGLGVPTRIRGIVVGMYPGRMMFPPKDRDGNLIPMPGVKSDSKGPICWSADRLVGSRYGKCGECAYHPRDGGEKNDCVDNWKVYIVTPDFKNVYRIDMTSTSVRSGAEPIRVRSRPWDNIWDRVFSFEGIITTTTKGTFAQWKTTLAIDISNPNGIPTLPASHEYLELMACKIESNLYMPSLADCYEQAGGEMAQAEDNGSADMASVMAAAAARKRSAAESNVPNV